VTKKSPGEFAAESYSGDPAEDFEYCLLKKIPFRNLEHAARHKDGRTRVLESSGNPFFDEAGRYKGCKGLTRDITDRKRLEDEHAMKAMLLDSVKDAVFLHDTEGRIVYANEAAYVQLGYAGDSLSNMMFQRLLTPASAKDFSAQTEYAVKHGKVVFESEHVRTDGGIMPVETQAHSLELDGEKFVLRLVRDISERKLTEKALKESEEKFRVTFENAPVGMCLTNTEGRILSVNGTLCGITGYSREQILQRSFTEFTHPEEIGPTSDWLRRLLAEEPAAGSVEQRYLGSDGRVINMEVSASVLRQAQGKPAGLIMALKDITRRKEAERAQKQLMKELEKTNSEISQFNSLIAHDLQEPLRMVRSYSQLLEKRLAGKLDAEGEEFFSYVMNGGKLMQKMLEDLMLYLHQGANPEKLQDTDMNEIVAQALALLKSSISENQAAVSCGRLPVIFADKTQMLHLLQNLLGNAIKFKGGKPPDIYVKCEAGETSYVFSVGDTGIGIAPQFLDRIFKIFQRLHTREEYPGTGVGLALCRKIVENHGGRIWAKSEPGKGTVICFTIPKQAAAEAKGGGG
jgi:PAS domain S-box-containing protein